MDADGVAEARDAAKQRERHAFDEPAFFAANRGRALRLRPVDGPLAGGSIFPTG